MSDITPEEAQPDEFPDAPVFAVDINANEPPLDSEEFANYVPVTPETEDEDEADTEGEADDADESEKADDAEPVAASAEVKAKADAMDALRAQFESNPVEALKNLMEQLGTNPQDFAKMADGKQPESEEEPDSDWVRDDGTPPERIVWDNRDFVKNGATYMQSIVQQNNQTRAIGEYSSSLLEAKVNALLEMNGVQLPEADKATNDAIIALTQKGKSVREAVLEVYLPKAKAAVTAHQQKAKPQPKTPGNRSPGAPAKIKSGASANDIWVALGRPKLGF